MVTSSIPLSDNSLDKLSQRFPTDTNSDLPLFPQFDRDGLIPSIVCIGGSSVLCRALFVTQIEKQNNRGARLGVVSVSCGSESTSRDKFDKLKAQNGLYTIHEHDGIIDRTRLIGSVIDVLFAADDPQRVIQQIANPNTQIVTLSITAKGYHFKGISTAVDLDRPEVRNDIDHPQTPLTALGYILEGLDRRRQLGQNPPIILTLENIQNNGDVIRNALLAMADAREDKSLHTYIQEHANTIFPNTMVDKICPSPVGPTFERETLYLAQRGVRDDMLVCAEPFGKLVVEDVGNLRDILLSNGVFTIVPREEVAEYELAKLRMLNGMHRAVGILGQLAGYKFVHEAVEDLTIRNFVQQLGAEIHSTLPPNSDARATFSSQRVLERFSNSSNPDELRRLTAHSTGKLGERIVAPLMERLGRGESAIFSTFVLACWINMLRAENDYGNPIEIKDEQASKFELPARAKSIYEQWKANPDLPCDPTPILNAKGLENLFPPCLRDNFEFRSLLGNTLSRIYCNNQVQPGCGTLEALKQILDEETCQNSGKIPVMRPAPERISSSIPVKDSKTAEAAVLV